LLACSAGGLTGGPGDQEAWFLEKRFLLNSCPSC
jgi:hypothetical protein